MGGDVSQRIDGGPPHPLLTVVQARLSRLGREYAPFCTGSTLRPMEYPIGDGRHGARSGEVSWMAREGADCHLPYFT